MQNSVINPDGSTYVGPQPETGSPPTYPLWMYNPTAPAQLVNNPAQFNALMALNAGWTPNYLPPYYPPTIPPFNLPSFVGTFTTFANLVAQYLATNLPAGTMPIAYTLDSGWALWDGVDWTIVNGALSSNDGSVIITGSPGVAPNIQVDREFYGALNVLNGTYAYAGLPPAAQYPNMFAATTDQGGVFSNGQIWQQLYNPTSATIQISNGTPLPPATFSVSYSQALTATQGTAPYTWALASQYGAANTVVISGSTLQITNPSVLGSTYVVVQVVDSTGARAQLTLAIPVIASTTLAATPTFSPVAGIYATTQTVTISDSTAGAVIHYTTDGSAPTSSSSAYSAPLSVSATSTLQAIAIATGLAQSAIGSAAYTISSASSPAATPTFSPVGGNYTSAQTVTISCSTASPTIYYTLDGTTPTTGSSVYSAPLTVSATKTIQAIATASGFTQSGVGNAAYTITIPPPSQAATPTFSPVAGSYSRAQTVTLVESTGGATVYYTTNGSAPTTSSTVYTGPIAVNITQTIKAIATAAGFTQSNVGSAAYTITAARAAAVLSYLTGLATGTTNRVLTGQHYAIFESGYNSTLAQATSIITPLQAQTGQMPAIVGVNLNFVGALAGAVGLPVTEQVAAQQYARNGFLHVSIYSGVPISNTGPCTDGGVKPTGSNTVVTPTQFHQIATTGTTLNGYWHAQLDQYAAEINKITPNGEVVLLRMFIEINLSQNWYAGQNGADFIALQQDTYNYMNVTKGLAGKLLWIFNLNPFPNNQFNTYYPGDGYVDILSFDMYTNDQATFVNFANTGSPAMYSGIFVPKGKPILVSEYGPYSDNTGQGRTAAQAGVAGTLDSTIVIRSIKASLPNIVGFLSWDQGFDITGNLNASTLMNDAWCINAAGIPVGLN